jgi:hypothetical protein
VSADDGQVMPETCRDFEPQESDSESEVYQVGCVYYVTDNPSQLITFVFKTLFLPSFRVQTVKMKASVQILIRL